MNLLAILAAAVSLGSQEPNADLSRHVYPLATATPSPKVVIDVSESPESKKWAETAKALVESWYPQVVSLLATESYRPPKEIRLVFKPDLSAPAYASGGTITINGKWIASRPDDLGMVIHELTHVVQAYPDSPHKTGWLVEGIADYIRWWRYEPESPRPRIDPQKAKYTDAYRTTAYFLAWASRKHHMGLVPALDRALRNRENPLPVFERLTGRDVDTLWKEFIAAKP